MDDERDEVEEWLASRAGENLAGGLLAVVGVVVVGWVVAVLLGWV